MRRKKSALKIIFPLVSIAIIFFGGIFIFRSLMEKFLSSSFPISVPETPVVLPSAVSREDSRPFASITSTANGSFTELFSGTGWLNQEKSNVYQDQKLSSISFPPDYEWQPVVSLSNPEVPELSNALKAETIYGEQSRTIIAADGNGKEIVLVAKSGKIFEFRGDSAQITQIGQTISASLNKALLDYDDSAGVWIVAASSDSGIEVGPVNRPVSVNAPGAITDLACANGECLVNYGSLTSIGSFSINNPSELSKINLQSGKSFNSISLGSVDSRSDSRLLAYTLVGVVEKTDSTSSLQAGGTYTGSIFKYNSPFPKGSTPQGGGISSSPFLPVAEKLFSSPYPGTIRFGYDSENDEILALYAAYIGQAYKFSIDSRLDSRLFASTAEDYSRFFPQRVMDGSTSLTTSGDGIPKIFKYGNAWWLSSEINQASTKFIRIEGGAGIDFADTLLRGQQTFELLPGFDNPRPSASTLYGIVGNQIYKFTDKGYKKDKKIVWESLRLNRFDNEITGGRFYKINGSTPLTTSLGEGGNASEAKVSENSRTDSRGFASIRYYLSNDGGKTWQETKLNEMVNFATKGNDFRFKVELNSAQNLAPFSGIFRADSLLNFQTPWLNLISVEYYSK